MTISSPGLFVSKKQGIDIIACEATYQNLATFENIKELNETVNYYKDAFSEKLNKTTLAVLDLLKRYSANEKKKSVGVSYLRKNKIGELLGKSRRTIIRSCQLLESLGIIRQYDVKRNSDMRQTSNAIVIQPIQEIKADKIENVTQDPIENQRKVSHQKNKIYSLKQNIKTYKKRNAIASRSVSNLNSNSSFQTLDASFTASYVPKEFVAAVKPFFDEAAVIEDYWKSVFLDTRKIKQYVKPETITFTAISAFKQSVRSFKQGKVKSTLVRYFTGTFKRLMDNAYGEIDLGYIEEQSNHAKTVKWPEIELKFTKGPSVSVDTCASKQEYDDLGLF